MIIDHDELFARGLVEKLELHPTSRYILLFKAGCVPPRILSQMQTAMERVWGIGTICMMVDEPREALRGIELIEQPVPGGTE